MSLEKDELMMLGKLDGKLDLISGHLTQQDKRIDALDLRMEERIVALTKRMNERHDAIDARLRTVEQRAAVAGALGGSAVSIGIALAIEGVKHWLSRGGPSP